jgi:hypothetical protein
MADSDSNKEDPGYGGIQRVTGKVEVSYTVMNKQRSDVPSTEPGTKANIEKRMVVMSRPKPEIEEPQGKAEFQRSFVVMSPPRPKKEPPKGIGSIYI